MYKSAAGLLFLLSALLSPTAGCSKSRIEAEAELRARTTAEYEPDECVVCHYDIEFNWKKTAHFSQVGCTACHGASDEHMGVEDNSIRPDFDFDGNESDDICGECHATGVSAPQHPEAGKSGPCADCHKPH